MFLTSKATTTTSQETTNQQLGISPRIGVQESVLKQHHIEVHYCCLSILLRANAAIPPSLIRPIDRNRTCTNSTTFVPSLAVPSWEDSTANQLVAHVRNIQGPSKAKKSHSCKQFYMLMDTKITPTSELMRTFLIGFFLIIDRYLASISTSGYIHPTSYRSSQTPKPQK